MSTLYSSNTRLRRDFGMPCKFQDSKTRSLFSTNSQLSQESKCEDSKQWVSRRYSTIEIDCTPQYATHTADTGNFIQKPGSVSHVNGAWPKKVKGGEVTERQRYLQRLTAEGAYFNQVPQVCDGAQRSVAQNNTLDLYEEYFQKGDIFETDEATMTMKTMCVLKDPCELKRHANKICWAPDGSGKIVVSYAIMKFQKMNDVTPCQSYIWDINNPNEPVFEFLPMSPLCSMQFNPKTHDCLAGGMYNGTIGFWDLRKDSGRPVSTSNIEFSHHDPVFDISYISSRSGTECVSASTDGRLLWWDTRKLDKPIDEFVIQTDEKEVMGISALEYKLEGPTKYLVGTEKGIPVLMERKAKKDQPSEKKIKAIFSKGHGGHLGAVRAIKRNPIHMPNFLTVGDWSVKLWTEENLKSPIVLTSYGREYLTSACWSSIRPGVFFTGKQDGTMDVWDIYSKQSEAMFTTKISEAPICTINCHKSGQTLAIGCEDGTTSIMSLGRGLSTLQRMEKEVVQEIFEREKKRESVLDKRRIYERKRREREIRLKAKGGPPKKDPAKEEAERQKEIKKAEEHWQLMLKKMAEEEAEAAAAAAEAAAEAEKKKN